jgi:RNA polymerase sigma-70 factor, ECF subfamily
MTNQLSSPELWLNRYGDRLFSYALARVRDREIAADLLQETLLAAFKSQDGFMGQASEMTWLVGILKHKLVDFLRKSNRETLCNLEDELIDTEDNAFFDGKGSWQIGLSVWSNPDSALEQEEFMRVLQQCIDRLPPKMSQAFVLKEFDGMDNEEICEAAGISTLNNLWTILSRARLQLRYCLDVHWFGNKES